MSFIKIKQEKIMLYNQKTLKFVIFFGKKSITVMFTNDLLQLILVLLKIIITSILDNLFIIEIILKMFIEIIFYMIKIK